MTESERLARTRNHFELFGLPVRFTLDRHFVDSRYMELTRATHPDLAGAEADAQVAAMELSARVNEAYATLTDDLKRAEYLLLLRGATAGDVRLSPASMDRIFELREQLSTSSAAGDEQGIERSRAEAWRWLGDTMIELGEKLDTGESGEVVRELVSTARYLRKIVDA